MKTKTLVKITLCVFFIMLATVLYKFLLPYVEPRFNDFFVKQYVETQKPGSEDIVLVVIGQLL